jgi:hypothetical protein
MRIHHVVAHVSFVQIESRWDGGKPSRRRSTRSRHSATRIVLGGASAVIALQLALAHPRIEQVITPIRRPLSANKKLENPVSDRLEL